MSSISGWILSIFGVIVVSVAVDLLLGGTRIIKTVRCICACVTLLVIVTPIASLVSSGGSSFDFSHYEAEIDENYVKYVNGLKANALEKSLEKSLNDEGISNASVNVILSDDTINFTINLLEINLSESVIDEKFEHINRNDLIVDVVTKYVNIDESLVAVYG